VSDRGAPPPGNVHELRPGRANPARPGHNGAAMGDAQPSEITQLLAHAREGDPAAWDRLAALVYADLRRLAHQQLGTQYRERTLDTTGLVHECYLRLVERSAAPDDRGHFFALASRIMRQVIVDHARERLALKRGGTQAHIRLDDADEEELAQAMRFVALDDALAALGERSQRAARVVECRFFAGLTEQETAEALELSLRQVQREWQEAREWLARFMSE
jgi:RNA polymerase sigma factor (TIGR02999 family)